MVEQTDISDVRLVEIVRESAKLARVKEPCVTEWLAAIFTAITAYAAIWIFANLVNLRSTEWNEYAGIGTAFGIGVIAWVAQHMAWRRHYRSRKELFLEMLENEKAKIRGREAD